MARIPSMTELPSPKTRRWVARRKAAVVAAVSSGIITIEEACRRYRMSEEEFLAWQRAFENGGILACIRNNAAFVPPVVRPLGRRRDAANGWASRRPGARISVTNCVTGFSRDSATGASHSRSCGKVSVTAR